MKAQDFPKIEKLLNEGWDLTVSKTTSQGFHAAVHLGRIHGPDSHHHIGSSMREVLVKLEEYIDEPEGSAERRSPGPTR